MMQTLRKYMKHVMWIVAVAFVITLVFSWGMGGFRNQGTQPERGIIGIIDGQKVQYQQFHGQYQNILRSRQAQMREANQDETITETEQKRILDNLWQDLVNQVLLSEEIGRLNIVATDHEVGEIGLNDPPDFIKQNTQFFTDDQFDIEKYISAIRDPRNTNYWLWVENQIRSGVLQSKLQSRIQSLARVSDGELWAYYQKQNEKVSARYLFFETASMPLENISVGDEEITAYYDEHKDDFSRAEQRSIQYVMLEGKPSKADSLSSWQQMEDIQEDMKDGIPFDSLAKRYSQDAGTAPNGGDLGYFGRGTMEKPFEDAAFAAGEGQIVGPVETGFGLHLIQIVDRKRERGEVQVRARHILIKYETSNDTYDYLGRKAQSFREAAEKSGAEKFVQLAESHGFEAKTTPLFPRRDFIPMLGIAPRITFFTFEKDPGWVSQPMFVNNNLIVFQISEVQEESISPLEEVKERIQSILQREKQKVKAADRCREIRARIGSADDFDAAARADSLEILETGPFTLTARLSGIGSDPVFNGTAFSLEEGRISEPVEGVRGYYLIHVVEHQQADREAFEQTKESLRAEVLRQKMNQIYMAWYTQLRDKAEIEDYRYYFYN
jgi:parvulin-like peptidyl-prolyl isomerase